MNADKKRAVVAIPMVVIVTLSVCLAGGLTATKVKAIPACDWSGSQGWTGTQVLGYVNQMQTFDVKTPDTDPAHPLANNPASVTVSDGSSPAATWSAKQADGTVETSFSHAFSQEGKYGITAACEGQLIVTIYTPKVHIDNDVPQSGTAGQQLTFDVYTEACVGGACQPDNVQFGIDVYVNGALSQHYGPYTTDSTGHYQVPITFPTANSYQVSASTPNGANAQIPVTITGAGGGGGGAGGGTGGGTGGGGTGASASPSGAAKTAQVNSTASALSLGNVGPGGDPMWWILGIVIVILLAIIVAVLLLRRRGYDEYDEREEEGRDDHYRRPEARRRSRRR